VPVKADVGKERREVHMRCASAFDDPRSIARGLSVDDYRIARSLVSQLASKPTIAIVGLWPN
jgi:hypothetical protein